MAALKTYDTPPAALAGLEVAGVRRHGKFLDVEAVSRGGDPPPLHLITHLSRAGWVRWRDRADEKRLAQRGPLAARLRFEDGLRAPAEAVAAVVAEEGPGRRGGRTRPSYREAREATRRAREREEAEPAVGSAAGGGPGGNGARGYVILVFFS